MGAPPDELQTPDRRSPLSRPLGSFGVGGRDIHEAAAASRRSLDRGAGHHFARGVDLELPPMEVSQGRPSQTQRNDSSRASATWSQHSPSRSAWIRSRPARANSSCSAARNRRARAQCRSSRGRGGGRRAHRWPSRASAPNRLPARRGHRRSRPRPGRRRAPCHHQNSELNHPSHSPITKSRHRRVHPTGPQARSPPTKSPERSSAFTPTLTFTFTSRASQRHLAPPQ